MSGHHPWKSLPHPIPDRVQVRTLLAAEVIDPLSGETVDAVTLPVGMELTVDSIEPADRSVGIMNGTVVLEGDDGSLYAVDYADGYVFGGLDHDEETGEVRELDPDLFVVKYRTP